MDYSTIHQFFQKQNSLSYNKKYTCQKKNLPKPPKANGLLDLNMCYYIEVRLQDSTFLLVEINAHADQEHQGNICCSGNQTILILQTWEKSKLFYAREKWFKICIARGHITDFSRSQKGKQGVMCKPFSLCEGNRLVLGLPWTKQQLLPETTYSSPL